MNNEDKFSIAKDKFWSDFEYLTGLPHQHAQVFAHRKVENFDPEKGIGNFGNTAYAIRINPFEDEYYEPDFKDKFRSLMNNQQINQLEALIIGCWDELIYDRNNIVKMLIDNKDKIGNLEALFFGDIEDEEGMISDIWLDNFSPVLAMCARLQILHIRGGRGLEFSSESIQRHDKLKALRIESGNLPASAINDLCVLDLPALEYLELWMGREEYGGDSTLEDLMPIVTGKAFPNLKYLGLRNAEYTDEIVFELVKSPLIKNLIELDLSLGTLGIEGAEALLNCPAVNELDTLNISENWLGECKEIIDRFSQLDCNVIIGEQDYYDASNDDEERYCSVAE